MEITPNYQAILNLIILAKVQKESPGAEKYLEIFIKHGVDIQTAIAIMNETAELAKKQEDGNEE